MIKIIDPLEITEKDLPLIVLTDNQRGFLSWGIKAHSKGLYSHSMEMHRPGFLATQNWLYKEVPLKKYMLPHYRMKFWKPKKISNAQRNKWIASVQKDLAAPWWERRYDLLGIIGQLFFLRFINNPWTKYCSERVAGRMRKILGLKVRNQPSPSDLNKLMIKSDKMEVYGHWFQG